MAYPNLKAEMMASIRVSDNDISVAESYPKPHFRNLPPRLHNDPSEGSERSIPEHLKYRVDNPNKFDNSRRSIPRHQQPKWHDARPPAKRLQEPDSYKQKPDSQFKQ